MVKGLITVGREFRQQHPRDLLSGGDVPRAALSGRPGAGQQITRVLLPKLPTDRDQSPITT